MYVAGRFDCANGKAVMTFSACTPPLSEALKLWDFIFAFGAQMNILCVLAQIRFIRQELIDSPR